MPFDPDPFLYERAKLSLTGTRTHHESFGLLFMAARTAIDNNKAREMLNDLALDKDGDFYKLSRGHSEWRELEQALTKGDKNALISQDSH